MDMNGKKKFLIIVLLVAVALRVLLGHFWSYTVFALGKAVAAGLVLLLVFSKLLAGITGVHFLL
jgi:glycerol-3-phosphate acyltransferase PlsY